MRSLTKVNVLIVSILLSSILVLTVSYLLTTEPLREVHKLVMKNYPTVKHLSLEEYAQMDIARTLVFDVREAEEFEVSHLPGAIFLSPDTDAEDFFEDYGDQITGKELVFYCSVGRRSSEMISRLSSDSQAHQLWSRAESARNLSGGVFAWVNAKRSLQDVNAKATLKVHPYNKFWGQLIQDSDNRQY